MSCPELELREYAPQLHSVGLDEFVEVAAQKRAVDPLNAARLLGSNAFELLSEQTRETLYDLTQNHDGEPIANRIIAPLLRVTEDFKNEEAVVYKGLGHGDSWQHIDVFAIDEADQTIILQPLPRTRIQVSPQSPSMFSERDDLVLTKPERRRPEHGFAAAARFALCLSFFDQAASNEEFSYTIRNAHRHYSLIFLTDSFKRPGVHTA